MNTGREKLIATARDLFTRRGTANVGINDVTAAAGVAKMTLYNNFASKEALAVAVYEDLSETTLRDLRAVDVPEGSEKERIFALFKCLEAKARVDHYRGCPFIHASLQEAEQKGSIYGLVRRYKLSLRAHIFGILDQKRANRAAIADQILLLLDGAVTESYLDGVQQPTASAFDAAALLLAAPRNERNDTIKESKSNTTTRSTTRPQTKNKRQG